MKIEIEVNNLAELRTKRGFTQTEVAELLGLTQQGYGLIENGKRSLKAEVALMLSSIFGVPVDKIIFLTSGNNIKLLKK